MTPLMWAVWSKNAKVISLLLKKGAKVNSQTVKERLTALHISCMNGDFDTTRLLIRQGADISARTTFHESPLLYAQHSPQEGKYGALLVKYLRLCLDISNQEAAPKAFNGITENGTKEQRSTEAQGKPKG